MRILAILVLTPALAAGIVAAAIGLVGRDVPVPQQPTSLVWGDRAFASQHDFAVWLESRGASYKLWTKRHPAAAGVFAPRSGRRFAAAPEARSAEAASSRERQIQGGRAALFAATLLAIVLGIAALRPRLRRVHVAIQLPRRSRHVGTGDTVRKPPLLRHAAIAVRPRPGSMSLRAPPANTSRHVRGIAVRKRWNGVAGVAPAGVERVHVGTGAVVVRRLLRRYLPTVASYGISALLVASSMAQSVVAALSELPARLEHRRRLGPRDVGGETLTAFDRRMLVRETVRRWLPDIALYVTGTLLACVLGASIAIYLD